LFDSDVLLDVLAQREPFVSSSALALDSAVSAISGYVAGHAVTNIFYILRRQVSSDRARELLLWLLEHLQIASVTDEVIRAALANPMRDFEDAVTSEASRALGMDVIVTRNVVDFSLSSVPALPPSDFLVWLEEADS
jgi:predicted nucleic-acid-binding protein